jgi:hypothetical protein
MRGRWFAFVAVLFLVVNATAQMRSSVSAGGSMGRPHPPSGPGIRFNNHFNNGRNFGNFGGAVLYPYGFYDDFYGYGDRYSDPVEPPAPVVVVRDDRPLATAVAPAPTPLPPVDPKIIEVPSGPDRVARGPAAPTTAIFILSDGRKIEAQNYTVTDKFLTVKESHRPTLQIPFDQLNVEATLAANHARGLDLQLPENRSEILINF